MFEDLADALVWILRLALLGGLAWGLWLCLGDLLLPPKPERMPGAEHFATFVLAVLLLISTLGGFPHAAEAAVRSLDLSLSRIRDCSSLSSLMKSADTAERRCELAREHHIEGP